MAKTFEELLDQADLGDEATQLRHNEAYKAVMKHMQSTIFTAWRNSTPNEGEEREKVWLLQHALDRFEETLIRFESNGNHAHRELKKIKEEQDSQDG